MVMLRACPSLAVTLLQEGVEENMGNVKVTNAVRMHKKMKNDSEQNGMVSRSSTFLNYAEQREVKTQLLI